MDPFILRKNETMICYEDEAKQIIRDRLIPLIKEIGEPLEGNIFMLHHQIGYTDVFKEKRQNLISIFVQKSEKPLQVLEIGFNAGFSALLILLTNQNAQLTCVDICEHKYTIPCFNILKEMFGSRIELIQGSSVDVLPSLLEDTFDVIHVDGGHSDTVVENDCDYALRLSKKGTILIMDDYDFPNIKSIWDRYCTKYHLQHFSSSISSTPRQDIRIVP